MIIFRRPASCSCLRSCFCFLLAASCFLVPAACFLLLAACSLLLFLCSLLSPSLASSLSLPHFFPLHLSLPLIFFALLCVSISVLLLFFVSLSVSTATAFSTSLLPINQGLMIGAMPDLSCYTTQTLYFTVLNFVLR